MVTYRYQEWLRYYTSYTQRYFLGSKLGVCMGIVGAWVWCFCNWLIVVPPRAAEGG